MEADNETLKSQAREYVRELALMLYDKTRPLHELDESCRRLLAMASEYQDVAIPQGRKKALKAAKAIIDQDAGDDLNDDEKNLLAAIVAMENSDLKRKHIKALELDPIQEREALTLISILRIATGLNESKSQATNIQQIEVNRDKMWIVVNGPEAALDATVAQHNAALWEKVGYPRVKVLEASEAKREFLPYPEPIETPGLFAEDPMAEAGRKILRYHFANMLAHEAGTVLGEEIEELHKMRVATRRMRAAFAVFAEVYEPQVVKDYLGGLRRTGRSLGRVRDLDVLLNKANIYCDELPESQRQGMTPLLQDWKNAREEARLGMINYFESDSYRTFKRKFNIFLGTPGAGAQPVPKNRPISNRVLEIAPVMIYESLGAVRAYEPWLEDATIELMHALRIEMKRLRYTLEFFQEILGPQAETVIEMMKRMQDHLGDLNDAQIAAQLTAQFLNRWDLDQEALPISERQNPETIVTYMASRHAEVNRLIHSFKQVWADFNNTEMRQALALSLTAL